MRRPEVLLLLLCAVLLVYGCTVLLLVSLLRPSVWHATCTVVLVLLLFHMLYSCCRCFVCRWSVQSKSTRCAHRHCAQSWVHSGRAVSSSCSQQQLVQSAAARSAARVLRRKTSPFKARASNAPNTAEAAGSTVEPYLFLVSRTHPCRSMCLAVLAYLIYAPIS